MTRMPWTISFVSFTRWSVSADLFLRSEVARDDGPWHGTESSIAPRPARKDGPMIVASQMKQTIICKGGGGGMSECGE